MNSRIKKLALHWQIFIGIFVGLLLGIIALQFSFGPEFIKNWIKPFGIIFIKLLKLIAVPLVFASLAKGVSDLKDLASLSQMGGRTVFWYLFTTVFAKYGIKFHFVDMSDLSKVKELMMNPDKRKAKSN